PAILLGAFLTNITAHETIPVALGIAAGNTLEAVAGAWMLRRFITFDTRIARLTDVMALTFLAAGVSTAISATIGAASLCLGGLQPWGHYGSLWLVWWLGDAGGDLIVAAFLLVWFGHPRIFDRRRLTEAILLIAGLIACCLAVFLPPIGMAANAFLY